MDVLRAPLASVVKLNVDGSVIFYDGYGGLLRDSNGSWIFGFSRSKPSYDVLRMKFLAIMKDLQFAWESSHQNIICGTDSLDGFMAVSDFTFHQ